MCYKNARGVVPQTCFVSCDVLQTDVSETRMEYRRVSPSASDLPELAFFHYVSFKIVEMMCRECIFVIDLRELPDRNYLTSIN